MNRLSISTMFDSPPSLENYGELLQELYVSFPEEMTIDELNSVVTQIGTAMLIEDSTEQKTNYMVCVVERYEVGDDFVEDWFAFALGRIDGDNTTWIYDNGVS
jgi:hypothetical protein